MSVKLSVYKDEGDRTATHHEFQFSWMQRSAMFMYLNRTFVGQTHNHI